MADKNYDAALGMYREGQRVVSLPRIRFIRWLVDHGRLEHYPAGPPSGHVAALLADVERRS